MTLHQPWLVLCTKKCIQVAHVEAGIRSGDWTMPEEINHVITDSITNWFSTTSRFANDNLDHGVDKNRIFFVGNTMIDTLNLNMKKFKAPSIWYEKSSEKRHIFFNFEPANVDKIEILNKL